MSYAIELDRRAVALRPVRALKDGFRYYEATTFENPWQGCEMYLRRCAAFGMLKADDGHIVLDVLDEHGDVVQDFPLTREGLRYLRREFRFKVEWEDKGGDAA